MSASISSSTRTCWPNSTCCPTAAPPVPTCWKKTAPSTSRTASLLRNSSTASSRNSAPSTTAPSAPISARIARRRWLSWRDLSTVADEQSDSSYRRQRGRPRAADRSGDRADTATYRLCRCFVECLRDRTLGQF